MKTVLVTGSKGFIGKNLMVALRRYEGLSIVEFDLGDSDEALALGLSSADIVFHLAGVNRPQNPEEFTSGNLGLTEHIIELVRNREQAPPIIMTSSIQAELDNSYGTSKRAAEQALEEYRKETGNNICIYRLPNVFGKWCRPFYNSVVATFCHNLTHNEPISVSDPAREIHFIYIDDVVATLMRHLDNGSTYQVEPVIPGPTYAITLGKLASILTKCRDVRAGGLLPDLSNKLEKYLYSTFVSYYEKEAIKYSAEKKEDARGYLFELIKTESAGQIFVSRTLPGITRGNHYHDTKIEKFCVLEGTALIRLRNMITNELNELRVEGHDCTMVDIPPGWSHSITNIGTTDLITLFWANEVFDPERPDTYYSEV